MSQFVGVTKDFRVYLATETFAPALRNPERAWFHIENALVAGFPHLNWSQVHKPPPGYFDATFVRQIGFYIFCIRFGVPKKRAMKAAGLTPDGKWRAFNRIARRMTTMTMRDHVNRITQDAKQRINEDSKI